MTEEGASIDCGRRLLPLVARLLVHRSFQRCCSHGHAFFDAFYANLADKIPGVGVRFAYTDMEKQNNLVCEGIQALIDYASGDPAAERTLNDLGSRHARNQLDVPPDLYPRWVDALLMTMAEYDAERTDDLEAAWRAVLAPGVALMAVSY